MFEGAVEGHTLDALSIATFDAAGRATRLHTAADRPLFP
jgi:hypothetical protein